MNLFRKHKKFEEQLSEQLGDMEVKPSTSLWDRIDANITNDSFESGMQDSLENFEQMPYPETWDKIAAELPETKVRNGLARYYIVAAFAVLFASGIYIGNKVGTKQEAAITGQGVKEDNTRNDETIPADLEEIKEQNKAAQKGAQPQPISRNHDVSQKLNKVPNDLIAQNTIVKPSSSAKGNVQPNKVTNPKESSPKLADDKSNNKQTMTPAAAAPVVSQPVAAMNVVQSNDQVSQPVRSENVSAKNNEPQVPYNNVPTINNIVVPTSNEQQTESGEQQATNAKQQIQNADAREVAVINPDSQLLAQKIAAINQLPAADELTKFSLSVFAGTYMCYTTYSIPSSATLPFEDNVKLRKQLERPAMDWSGGITIDYRLNKKWMVSGGLMMVNFNQEFNYDISTATQPADPNEVGAPVTNPSDSFIVGNKYSNRIKYSWTEIPVLVNYTIRKGKRVDIDIQAGASYAFISTIDGGMVSYDNKGALILNSKESFPYIQNTFFASLMPQVSYKFGQAVSVGLAPTVKYSITSIIGNNNWIQQHPYFIGMNICLRKQF